MREYRARLADAGLGIGAFSPHGNPVHSVGAIADRVTQETLLRLRTAVGLSLGINLDPSHLCWQGMEIRAVIAELGTAIFPVHAKEVALNPARIATNA